MRRIGISATLVLIAVASAVACGTIPTEYTVHVGKDCVSPPPLIPRDTVNFSPACPFRRIDPATGDTVVVYPPGWKP